MRQFLLIPILFLFLFFSQSAYSQSINSNDIKKDTSKVTRNFKDAYGNEVMQYYKHWLMAELDTTRLNDLFYLDKVINFLEDKRTQITDLLIDTVNHYQAYNYLKDLDIAIHNNPVGMYGSGLITIRLSNAMDAFDYQDIFIDSKLFLTVTYKPVFYVDEVEIVK